MLTIGLHADGGIRLETPDGQVGFGTTAAMRDWIARANRDGTTVRLTGELAAPLASPVAADVRGRATRLEEAPGPATAWSDGRSSIQTAAYNGLAEQVTELLARGVDATEGRGRNTPARLAMQRGWIDVLVALRDGGVPVSRRLRPPASLPDAVVLRRYVPSMVWWGCVPLLAVAAVAAVAQVWSVAAVMVGIVGVVGGFGGFTDWALGSSRVAVDGPQVARKMPIGWQGRIDLRQLDAIGYAPYGGVRIPALWILGHPSAGHKSHAYARRDFTKEQLDDLRQRHVRFVVLDGYGGFLSSGLERHLAAHLPRESLIAGSQAEARIWPD